jgi:hypothetical protein
MICRREVAPLRITHSVRRRVGPSDGWMVRPHDEFMKNLLMSKTGYVKIASRLGFGINLVLSYFSIDDET